MHFLQKISGSGLFLAESDIFEWIIPAIFFFIIFLAPILKKVAEALGLTKSQPPPGRRPGGQSHQPQQGPVKQILDEVERYFRQDRESGKPVVQKEVKDNYKEYSEYDRQYGERKRELAELRKRRDKRIRDKWEMVESQPLKPVIEEPEGLVIIEEPEPATLKSEEFKLESGLEVNLSSGKIGDSFSESFESVENKSNIRQEGIMDIVSGLPEIAKVIVLNEVLSKPKSLKGYSEIW